MITWNSDTFACLRADGKNRYGLHIQEDRKYQGDRYIYAYIG
jgi:hypothetical protein